MSVFVRDGITTGQSVEHGTVSDPYIRVRDILEIHRTHFPGHYDQTHDTPSGEYDCRVVRQRDIQRFRIRGKAEWADYLQIVDTFEERRKAGRTGLTALASSGVVFARVKIVIAEQDEPIRAALTFEPVYPRRGKSALLRQGQSLWMAYAALAVLNSALGQALYRQDLLRREGRSRGSDGISLQGLENLPVARLGYEPATLERVAVLSCQIGTLYAAEQECAHDFEEELAATHERLRWATRELLGFSIEEAEELIRNVACLDTLKDEQSSGQANLFKEPRDLPPHPPVHLLTLDDRINLDRLAIQSERDELPDNEKRRLDALKGIAAWDAKLKLAPPRDTPQEAPLADEVEKPPYYIENIRGTRLPVQLLREVREGGTYEYYPLGTHIVAAPGVCGGRATFKFTRIDVCHLLPDLVSGRPGNEISSDFGGRLSAEAVEEARSLVAQNDPDVFTRELISQDIPRDNS